MKSKLIALLIAVVIIAGGAGAYVLSQDKDDSASNSNETTQTNNDAEKKSSSDARSFNPLATVDESFSAMLTVTDVDGVEEMTGVINRDAAGNTKFSGTQEGETVEFYVTTDGKYIVCQAEDCFSLTGGTVPFDTSDFTASEADIAKYKETAKYIDDVDCKSGTCESWEYVDEEGSTVNIYINKEDRKVSEVNGSDENGSKVKIVYTYEDVTVTLPENVQEIPGGI